MKCRIGKSEHVRKNGMRRGKQNHICVNCTEGTQHKRSPTPRLERARIAKCPKGYRSAYIPLGKPRHLSRSICRESPK